jgi:serine/threonine-protein kinase
MSSPDPPQSSAVADETAAARIGSTIAERYTIEGLLGEGGMGAVYLVQHKSLRKKLAMKLLRPEYMRNPTVLARFEREAVAAAHLSHPNVAAASDFGRTEDGHFFLVLEYIEGRELREVLTQAQGPLPLPRVLFITRQILSALVRAHELGIVHRDLKPENIMLVKGEGHSDHVKVLDFGLAHVPRKVADELPVPALPEGAQAQAPTGGKAAPRVGSKITKVGDIIGTPAYMAPEQSIGEETDVRSDLYSLGIVVYEMLAGARPFTGQSLLVLMQQHLTIPPPPFSQSAPSAHIPKPVEELVRRLLAKEPSDRFQTPQEVLERVDALFASLKLRWPPPSASASQSHDAVTQPRIPAIHRAITAIRQRSLALVTGSAGGGAAGSSAVPVGAESSSTWQGRLLTSLHVPGPLRERLLQTPRWPWLLAVGVLVIAAGAITALALHSPDESGTVTVGKPRAAVRRPAAASSVAQAEIDAVTAQGPAALLTLAQRYPTDPRIRRAIVHSYISARRYAEALPAIAELAALDPGVGRDLEIIQAIVAALNDPATSNRATELLERDLGEAGVELLYDLTTRQTGARWKSRLMQSLAKPEVLANASPALRVAIDLRAAKRCEAKRDLLPRVQSEGDARALTQLRALAQTQGCGFLGLGDCFPCLRKGTVLRDAITALEARFGTANPQGEKP